MPQFVLLEHSWRGVHHDLMLETPHGLATWAIDDPLVPGAIWRARRLADHRLAYLDYEGPVSRDRGSVRRIDKGTYDTLCWEPTRVVARLSGQVLRGVIELRVEAPGGLISGGDGESDWRCWMRNLD